MKLLRRKIYANTSPAGTTLYRNNRNENKYIETRKIRDGHTEYRQFMFWDTDRGPVKNYMGSKTNRGRWHRTSQASLNKMLEDYTEVEDVYSSTRGVCPYCGTPLNDGGTCPVCDDGEEDY